MRAEEANDIRDKFGIGYLAESSRKNTDTTVDEALERALATSGAKILASLKAAKDKGKTVSDLTSDTGIKLKDVILVVQRLEQLKLIRFEEAADTIHITELGGSLS